MYKRIRNSSCMVARELWLIITRTRGRSPEGKGDYQSIITMAILYPT